MGKNVSFEDVKTAVEELLASDDPRVSVARVIRHLGRGSATTVTKHLRAVRETEDDEPKSLQPVGLQPEEIINALAVHARDGAEAMFKTLMQPINELEKRQQEYLKHERMKIQMDNDEVILQAIEATQRSDALQMELITASKEIGEKNAELAAARNSLISSERHEQKRAAEEETLRQQLLADLRQMLDRVQESVKESAELRGQLAAKDYLIKQQNVVLQRLFKYANANKKFQRRPNGRTFTRGLPKDSVDIRLSALSIR